MKKFSALLFVLVFVSVLLGQTNKTKEIKRINSYVKTVSSYVDENLKNLEIYADVSETAKPKWRKFNSEASLEKFRENSEVYTIAYVWRKNQKVVAVDFTFTSGSGDWAHYVFHRFREDGTLAKVEADLRTFYGNVRVVRNFYFDKNGWLIKKDTAYLDIKTDKPKQPKDGFIDNEVKVYKTIPKLPFITLVK